VNSVDFTKWFEIWTSEIQTHKIHLSDLDNAIGDGDHGFNMAKGVAAYQEAHLNKQDLSIGDECKLIGMSMLSKVGGASGPLYGSAFLAMAKSFGDTKEITHDQLVAALTAGVESIMYRGKASRYEKTMIDVWLPVIESLKQNNLTEEMIDSFVNETGPLKATKGRAAYLGDRSIGHIDPGSFSSGLLFKALLKLI